MMKIKKTRMNFRAFSQILDVIFQNFSKKKWFILLLKRIFTSVMLPNNIYD